MISGLVILTLLTACVSDPAWDDSSQGRQAAPQSSRASAVPDGKAVDGDSTARPDTRQQSQGGGCCGGNLDFNGNPRVLLGVIVVIVVVGTAIYLSHLTSDYIDKHYSPSQRGAVKDGMYRAKDGLFTVAVPGDYPAPDGKGIKIREIVAGDQKQVVFMPAADGESVYGVSVEPRLSASDAAMSLEDFASKLKAAPEWNDRRESRPVLDEKLTLDGEPALFREYFQPGRDGSMPVYYLLYFIQTPDRAALVSITWTDDCPKCAAGPQADVRAMDPHLKQFVESFHLGMQPKAVP